MNEKQSIQVTRAGFESNFQNPEMYNRQTQDMNHLDKMIETMNIQSGKKILDLGTGTGYVAFEIANRYKNVQVVGLDIVEKTLEMNRQKAMKEGVSNIRFQSYEGREFPFTDSEFDIVVSRYALHHFPNIQFSLFEVSRVLKNGGLFLIADPTPNDNDTARFVDEFMQLKPDAHIKYYTKEEYEKIAHDAGFVLDSAFLTEITFPRTMSCEYNRVINRHTKEIVDGYQVMQSQDKDYIFITQKVWNLLFQNTKGEQ